MLGSRGEIFILERAFNPVLGHANREGSDTERNVCGRRPIAVLAGSAEAFKGHV
jgi:hypothetical protein